MIHVTCECGHSYDQSPVEGHRVLCGDATKADDVAALMGGEQADMVFTDPPYGVSYGAKNVFLNAVWPANRIQKDILGDQETPTDMSEAWRAGFGNVRKVMRPGGAYYTTGPQGGDLLLLLLLALRDSGFPLRHMLIWAKNQFVIGRSDYHYQHEPLLYGWVEGAGHRWYGDHSQASVWNIDKPRRSDLHPTMKPVALIDRALRNSSAPGDLVIDPYAGSGSTLIAAQMCGRRARLLEIDPAYVDVIVARWEAVTGGTAVLDAPPLAPAPNHS